MVTSGLRISLMFFNSTSTFTITVNQCLERSCTLQSTKIMLIYNSPTAKLKKCSHIQGKASMLYLQDCTIEGSYFLDQWEKTCGCVMYPISCIENTMTLCPLADWCIHRPMVGSKVVVWQWSYCINKSVRDVNGMALEILQLKCHAISDNNY